MIGIDVSSKKRFVKSGKGEEYHLALSMWVCLQAESPYKYFCSPCIPFSYEFIIWQYYSYPMRLLLFFLPNVKNISNNNDLIMVVPSQVSNRKVSFTLTESWILNGRRSRTMWNNGHQLRREMIVKRQVKKKRKSAILLVIRYFCELPELIYITTVRSNENTITSQSRDSNRKRERERSAGFLSFT